MNVQMFEIEYEYPDVGLARIAGKIEQSDDYVVVISQWIENYDICGYTVIPKRLVKKIVELDFE